MIANIKNFSLSEALSNDNGKSSASGLAGMATVLTGLAVFVFGAFKFMAFNGQPDILMYSSWLVSAGLGVLTYRKAKTLQTPGGLPQGGLDEDPDSMESPPMPKKDDEKLNS